MAGFRELALLDTFTVKSAVLILQVGCFASRIAVDRLCWKGKTDEDSVVDAPRQVKLEAARCS